MLTPCGGLGLGSAGSRTWRAGSRTVLSGRPWRVPCQASLSLEVTRDTSPGVPPADGIRFLGGMLF